MLSEATRTELARVAQDLRRGLLDGNPEDWTTANVLASQFRENTGRHMLDSGDHYGRNWERAVITPVCDDPVATELTARWGYIETTIDAESYCNAHLEYCSKADQHFQQFAETDPDSYWTETVQSWIDLLRDYGKVTGIYGDGDAFGENTYSGESVLSSVLQYDYLEYEAHDWEDSPIDDGAYLVLQTHNGADVRGGYSAPRVYAMSDESFFFYNDLNIAPDLTVKGYDWSDVLVPDARHVNWSTDDTCHWYYQGTCGRDAGKQLETYPIVDLDDLADYNYDNGTRHMLGQALTGIIIVSDDAAHCPITGRPLRVVCSAGF